MHWKNNRKINQSSSQSNVVDDHESLSDKNESYLGRNGNSS